MKEETEIRVKRVLMDEFGVDEEAVTPDASLIADLGLDEPGCPNQMELLIRLEEEFAIGIPEAEMDQVHTVADLYQCVLRNR